MECASIHMEKFGRMEESLYLGLALHIMVETPEFLESLGSPKRNKRVPKLGSRDFAPDLEKEFQN